MEIVTFATLMGEYYHSPYPVSNPGKKEQSQV
jgi:hypothetical protein